MLPEPSGLQRVGTIWTLSPGQPLQPVQPRVAVRFARLDIKLAGTLADFGELSLPEIRQRLESGRRCYAAWAGDRLAAYGWVSYGEEYVGELDLHLLLRPGDAYIWDCFTMPEFRQKLLYSALLVYIANEVRADGPCRVWIGADFDNQPSQKGIDRAGFQRVADAAVRPVVSPAVDPDLKEHRFEVLPYPGVSPELVTEASRVFFSA